MTNEEFKAIVQMVADRYPKEVFPDPDGKSFVADRYSAAGARLACWAILQELKAIEANT